MPRVFDAEPGMPWPQTTWEFDPPSSPESPPARLGPEDPAVTASFPTAPFADLEDEEKALNGWPRRLLHVPTLKSYEWQPGNVYGGFHRPLYNAITYTWGRFKVRETDPDYDNIDALPITGVPWTIPKVNPITAFTAGPFRDTLQAVAEIVTTADTPNGIEFVWLDIACIDQRDSGVGKARSDAEIGRQADIFGNARLVFVWLHSLDCTRLERICETLEATPGWTEQSTNVLNAGTPPTPGEDAAKAMSELLADPWFESLWALQEAFLNPQACILSSDARAVYFTRRFGEVEPRRADETHFTLQNDRSNPRTQVSLLNVLYWADVFRRPPQDQLLEAVEARIQKTGLRSLATGNPIATYIAASGRYAKRETDRVYAIQQIFRLRLGKSATNLQSQILPAGQAYTLPELQSQLGEQLMLKFPLLSQMHIYTRSPAAGQAWRINEHSLSPSVDRLPRFLDASTGFPIPPSVRDAVDDGDRSICKLGIRLVNSQPWGYFEGPACTFQTFRTLVRELADKAIKDAADQGQVVEELPNLLDLWPDVTEETEDLLSRHGGHQSFPNHKQGVLAAALVSLFPEEDLEVLLLGQERLGYTDVQENALGMLMHRRKLTPSVGEYWRRIAIWRCRPRTQEQEMMIRRPVDSRTVELLAGRSEHWAIHEGMFG